MSEPYTLVVTDIVGSTALWEMHAEAFKAALTRHDAALRRILTQTEGYEIRTEGDGFRLAFFRVRSALQFCLEAQATLASIPWPGLPAPLQVRIGVSTSTAVADLDSVTGRLDFRGPDLLLAERIAEAANGDQILVAETTVRHLQRQGFPSDRVRLQPLGRWLLTGAAEPIALWAAVPSGQPDRGRLSPRATPAPAIPSNLKPNNRFLVGADASIAEIGDAFSGEAPIVVLQGPAGVGKSAVALAFARALVSGEFSLPGRLDGGVWVCETGEVQRETDLLTRIADAMGLEGPEVLRAVGQALSRRGPSLLVLDETAGDMAGLVRSVQALRGHVPTLRVLVVSRSAVALGGRVVRLEPLPVPALPASKEALAALRNAPAVEIFARRARAVLPGFKVGSNLATIVRILNQVGGVPLVIELAAARLRVLSLAELETRLAASPLALLIDRRAERPDRHSTLLGLLDEAWAALPVAAQVGLARLSALRGSFDLPAATAVLATLPGSAAHADVLRVLQEEGLVVAGSGHRMRMTGPVGAYAAARLERATTTEQMSTRTRHAAFFAAYGDEDYLDRLARGGTAVALQNLRADLENLDAGFRFSVAQGHTALAVGTARAALEVYSVCGPAEEGVALARQVLALPDLTPAHRAALSCELGWLAFQAGQEEEARATLDRAVFLASTAQSPRLLGRALRNLAVLETEARRTQPARDACEAALSVTRMGTDPVGEGLALLLRGRLHRILGDLSAASADLEAARNGLQRAGAPHHAASALASLAVVRRERGDTSGATVLAEQALARFDEAGDVRNGAATRSNLGMLLADLGRLDEARLLLSGVVSDGEKVGPSKNLAFTLWALGLTCLEQGDLPQALSAVARAQRAVRGANSPYEARLHALRAELEARQQRLAEAEVWMGRAEEALARSADAASIGFLACHRAALALAAGELDAVSAPLSQARARFESIREITGLRATARLAEALNEAQATGGRR